MKLQEHEAKALLKKRGLKTPSQELEEGKKYVVKAQILANKRKEMGAIKFADNLNKAREYREKLLDTDFDGQKPEEVLIEEQIDFDEEYYVSFMYDTDNRSPVMVFSKDGGTGIEDREVSKLALEDDSQFLFRQFLKNEGFEGKEIIKLGMALQKLFKAFLKEDARLLEVNPLAKTDDGYFVLDAMMDLEDDANYRHSRDFPERNAEGGEKTEREKRAEKIDEDDHRGVAGKYTELDGDIGMMMAGGGASLTNMDALI